jgi:hypothetical protein
VISLKPATRAGESEPETQKKLTTEVGQNWTPMVGQFSTPINI